MMASHTTNMYIYITNVALYVVIVSEAEAVGGKVTHDLLHPGMCVVGDEVSGNLNMSGNRYIGGELLLCQKNNDPQQKTSI